MQEVLAKGSSVIISAVRFDSHKPQIGKKGVISKFIKTRGVYQIKLEDGVTWESKPENIKPA